MKQRIPFLLAALVGVLSSCVVTSCQQMQRPLVVNPMEDFGMAYRDALEQFRAAYPTELATYKATLIQEYAKLPETEPNFDELPLNLEPKI